MKKRILLTIALLALAFGLYAGANPDPLDVIITITIPGAKVHEFRTGFLAIHPIPTTEDPENPDEPMPEFTEVEWLKEWFIRKAYKAYRDGKDKIAKETSVKDPKATLFKYE